MGDLLHVPKPFRSASFLGRWHPPTGFWDRLLRLKIGKCDRLGRDCATSTSSISNPATIFNQTTISNQTSRIRGMTLIELLIVIVILTTLVGGVIPILSPNNDERKIQVAVRGLQSYITLAKAKAARTGLPHGIAFRESSPGNGVAIEVFGWETPPPFAGFSTASYVRIERNRTNGELFVQLILADSLDTSGAAVVPNEYTVDPLPPAFLRPKDYIVIDGVEYRFLVNSSISPLDAKGFYPSVSRLQVMRVSDNSLTYAFLKNYPSGISTFDLTAPKRYQIVRQPAPSAESPYQLPAGVGIDMQASVAEGGTSLIANRFPKFDSLYTARPANTAVSDTVGIMFSPTGAVSSVRLNGTRLDSVSRVVLLVGRLENGGLDPNTIPAKSTDPVNQTPWTLQAGEKVEDVQKRINWLNLDSRLLSITTSNGRSVVSGMASVPTAGYTTPSGANDYDTLEAQIEAAHDFAHEMTTAK